MKPRNQIAKMKTVRNIPGKAECKCCTTAHGNHLWDIANVTCEMRDYPAARYALSHTSENNNYGKGSGPFWLSQVSKNASSILRRSKMENGVGNFYLSSGDVQSKKQCSGGIHQS